jgi:hypothetical protein
MFGKNKIEISQIMATSKMGLKLSCLNACKNNIAEAERLYDFLVKDIADLPDLEPTRPTAMQQIKQSADEIFGWVNSHSEDFVRGWQLIQTLRGGVPTAPTAPANVPPIPMK